MKSGGLFLKDYISERVITLAEYIIESKATVRSAAKKFGVSKSTVHNDIRKRLLEIDKKLYEKVSNILEYHIDIKHIRGGESTKRKFLEKKCN